MASDAGSALARSRLTRERLDALAARSASGGGREGAGVPAGGETEADGENKGASAETEADGESDVADIAVSAPATGERIGAVPAGDEAAVAAAVERAREAQSAWRDRPVGERAAVLERFGDLVADRRSQLLDLLQLETGKSRRHAVEELLDVPVAASYYADVGPDLVADERRAPAMPGLTTAEVVHRPVGVVGVITPWNYPMTLSMADALPALAAGNAVLLVPDAKTPFGALAFDELLAEAGLPSGVFQVVTGEGSTTGPALVDRVDYVAFTGSTETGRAVAERAGRNLVDCSLELGGKNPLVVLGDADPATAARGAAQAAFSNAGQLCLAAERVYVVEDVYEPFVDELVGATRRLSLGTGFDYDDDVGSLIDGDQLARVEAHVDDALDRDATLLTGGRHRPDVGPYCYEPTVLTDVESEATVACEETFGPVVTVERVPDAGAAVAAANDSPYGLTGSVWTSDRQRGADVARDIDCGTVSVNDAFVAGWGAIDAPMGGMGDSGLGRRHGPEGLARYLESQTVATSRIGPLDVPPGVPTGWVAGAAFRLADLKRRFGRWFR